MTRPWSSIPVPSILQSQSYPTSRAPNAVFLRNYARSSKQPVGREKKFALSEVKARSEEQGILSSLREGRIPHRYTEDSAKEHYIATGRWKLPETNREKAARKRLGFDEVKGARTTPEVRAAREKYIEEYERKRAQKAAEGGKANAVDSEAISGLMDDLEGASTEHPPFEAKFIRKLEDRILWLEARIKVEKGHPIFKDPGEWKPFVELTEPMNRLTKRAMWRNRKQAVQTLSRMEHGLKTKHSMTPKELEYAVSKRREQIQRQHQTELLEKQTTLTELRAHLARLKHDEAQEQARLKELEEEKSELHKLREELMNDVKDLEANAKIRDQLRALVFDPSKETGPVRDPSRAKDSSRVRIASDAFPEAAPAVKLQEVSGARNKKMDVIKELEARRAALLKKLSAKSGEARHRKVSAPVIPALKARKPIDGLRSTSSEQDITPREKKLAILTRLDNVPTTEVGESRRVSPSPQKALFDKTKEESAEVETSKISVPRKDFEFPIRFTKGDKTHSGRQVWSQPASSDPLNDVVRYTNLSTPGAATPREPLSPRMTEANALYRDLSGFDASQNPGPTPTPSPEDQPEIQPTTTVSEPTPFQPPLKTFRFREPPKPEKLAALRTTREDLSYDIPEDTRVIDSGLTINFSAHTTELQSQLYGLRTRLHNAYPKIESLPYDVWNSNNRNVLRKWLKILLGKWETRFDNVENDVDGEIDNVLDDMVRAHELDNDAAERMANRFREVFGGRGKMSGDEEGSLNWDEFDAEMGELAEG